MKVFKFCIVALIAVFTFGSANAQIIVKNGPRHPRKVVVVKRRVQHRHYKRPVVVVRHRRY